MRYKSLSAVVLCSCIVLAAGFGVLRISLGRGEDSMIQRRYQEAVRHLQAALGEVDDAAKPRVLLLLGRAHALLGEHEKAVARYQQLAREHPVSNLLHKARWQQAETLATARSYRQAATLYRAEIERLTGHDRKEGIAKTYLSLADASLDKESPDYGRAVVFFDLAIGLGLSESSSRALRLRAAQVRLQEKNWGDALSRLLPLVKELAIDDGKLPAMLGLGRARLALGRTTKARGTLRDLIALDPKADEAGDAAYEIALSYGVPTPHPSNLDRALNALDELVARFPGHAKSRVAAFLSAQCLQHCQRSEDALDALRDFLAESAQLDLPEVALARAMTGDILAAKGKLTEAIASWRGYLQRHPAHQDWERVQRAIVDAKYRRAEVAYEQGSKGFARARELFAVFTREHPLDLRNPTILYVLADMHAQEEEFDRAREAFARCVSKYPRREESSHAQFRIGRIYEDKTFDYAKALAAYRKVTWGHWAVQARHRIAQLERKHLHLLTKRSFRSDETAQFMLTSRNIEDLRVRIYRLELETWFRATHLAGQVELLDIEVIAPDKTLEIETPDYRAHEQTERAIDIGYHQVGAYVVKVDDGELEATTMVLISDLGMIAKVSRQEFFVFTQNLAKDQVEPGVRVLLSDGVKIISEGLTGEDGVWRYRGDELQNLDRLRAFAVNASGSGAGSMALSGLGLGQGLTAKGYLFSDRPTYAPGETVQIKGIMRDVETGLYRLPRADDFRLRITSPAGQQILQQAIEFTEFGTFAIDLALPVEADLGQWRVLVDRASGSPQVYTMAFEVARFALPKLMIEARSDAAVVFRGEAIAGSFVLRHFYGEPATGKVVDYRIMLPDGTHIERRGTSDAEGKVPFRFETDELDEEALVTITGRVLEGGTVAQLVVPVVTQEFVPVLSMLRPVYLAGEPFDVQIKIADRSGKPLEQEGSLRLFERKSRQGVIAEVEVSSKEFRSGPDDGLARVVMQAAKGGSYVLRVECQDRFGNAISAELFLTISGEEDEIKLRMLSDRQSYKVGETLEVKVINRAGAKLALRTVQGDGILAYESLRLPAGESVMELPLEIMHAPNFALGLTMIDGQALRVVQRDFLVSRDLQLTLVPAHEDVLPGGSVDIEVTARDPQGKPVEAEVALSVVDAALLAIYPDLSPEIATFFYGHRRETEFRTSSSCIWTYEGESKAVSKDLLTEERRRIAVRKEASPDGSVTRTDDFFMGTGKISGVRKTLGSVGIAVRAQDLAAEYSVPMTLEESESESDAWSSLASDFGKHDRASMFPRAFLRDGRTLGREAVSSKQPRTAVSPMGAWWSSIRTDAAGKATVTLQVPASSSTWKLCARGVTRDSYVGQARAELRSAREVEVDLLTPTALVAGDVSTASLRIHNLSGEARRLDLSMVGAEFSRGLTLAAGREHVENIVLKAGQAGADMDLAVLVAGGHEERVEARIPVLPFGIEKRVAKSGMVRDRLAFDLNLPAGRDYRALSMRIALGADPDRDLVAMALGNEFRPVSCMRVDSLNEAIASRGIGALTVLAHLEANSAADPADRSRLLGMATGVVTRLLASQNKDGSYPWIGEQPGDFRGTSQTLRFLAMARQRGIGAVDAALDRAANWLLTALRRAPDADRAQAVLALAEVGRVRFESLNSLHRSRGNLGLEPLARLALAWQAAERGEMVSELAATLSTKLQREFGRDAVSITGVGLAARALLSHEAGNRDAQRAIDKLRGLRMGASYGTPMATAAVIEALVAVGDLARVRGADARVSVRINGHEVEGVAGDLVARRMLLNIPVDWLQARSNRVEISLRGEAPLHFSATLTGFTTDIRPEDRNDLKINVRRRYFPAYLRHGDQQVPQGFAAVSGRYQQFENLMTQLPVGESGRVVINFYLREENAASPMIVEEPILTGCRVAPESIRGNYDHLIVEPGRLIFYYRAGRRADNITYELLGRFSGRYRSLPTMVYSAARPDYLAYGPAGELEILPLAGVVTDKYRMTPDELRFLGKAHFDAGDHERAGGYLRELIAGWALRDDVFREIARMMLYVSIDAGDSESVVEFFEQLKDRHPELVIPFDKIVAIGQSYIDLGEFEAALLVFRATAESSFLKDAAVATTLERQGEIAKSMQFLRQLLETYPDLPTMRGSLYGIGQRLAELAAGISADAIVDGRVGSPEQLRAQGIAAFREFLIMFPEDALAEQVSFAWATTLVEGDDLQTALKVARAAIGRYPNSSLLDELLYTAGYVHFALGASADAFAILERVAGEDFATSRGGRSESQNRNHAIYLMGQIHHALGHPVEALTHYDRVKDLFSDAVDAANYFRRKQLALPEVSSFGLSEDVALELDFRNLSEVKLKVYRVDLMRLYILHKSLNEIRNIMLHGIAPYAERSVDLGDGADYRDRTETVLLDLSDPGAYLVVARSGDLFASGLILRSDLGLEVQEDFGPGRIRINVKRGDQFENGVHVKVVGSGDQELRSGETDLRGIYVAGDLVGAATVIVQSGEEFGFYRGEGIHQPGMYRPVRPEIEVPIQEREARPGKDFEAWDNNLRLNQQYRTQQMNWLQSQVLQKQQKGVDVYRTK